MSYRVVVLVSGHGSNLQALLNACHPSRDSSWPALDADIVGVLSNRADAHALLRAQQAEVTTAVVQHHDFATREAFDTAMMHRIDAWAPDVVMLAGFMRILSADFVRHYQGRLINIHPSLLPKHKGLHTHQRALDAGDDEHGCSVHFVTPELDGGPVIAQHRVRVNPQDTAESLAQRVHSAEHILYPRVLAWLATQRLHWQTSQIFFDGTVLSEPIQFTQ